jgi:LuxR family maltose regulon positive regulatory protein
MEGWPSGLFLSALAVNARRSASDTDDALGGGDRFVVDYLRLEVLSQLRRRELEFVTRTSVLHRLSGPLCDAVLGRSDSSQLLERFERTDVFVMPLDRHGGWYRYHRAFRDVLRHELDQLEPNAAGDLRRSAAAWCEANGRTTDAIAYADAAGDSELTAQLVQAHALEECQRGHVALAERWLKRLDREAIERHPGLAVTNGWVHAIRGRPVEAARWLRISREKALETALPDGATTAEPWQALLRAGLCSEGLETMQADAGRSLEGLPDGSFLRSGALMLSGCSYLFAGDDDRADGLLAEAVIESSGPDATTSVALAERSVIAMARGDWDVALEHSNRSRGILREEGLAGYVTSALTYAVAARIAAHRREPGSAREELGRARRLFPRLTYALPWLAVQSRLQAAYAEVALADWDGARSLSGEIKALLDRRPNLGLLVDEAAQLRTKLLGATGSWASTLTAAELRLLPLLPTHLSFREIADRLFVSRNTVKTQAMSVYRKLGVSSRSEAIRSATELGLLDSATLSRPTL